MSKEFIPYKEAIRLKKLGYDNVPGMGIFTKSTYMNETILQFHDNQAEAEKLYLGGITAPLWQQAFVWLADNHDLYCDVSPRTGATDKEFFYVAAVMSIKQNDKYYDTKHFYDKEKKGEYFSVYHARVEGLKRMLDVVEKGNEDE